LPLTTLGQETRWAYSTPPPSPHGAGGSRGGVTKVTTHPPPGAAAYFTLQYILQSIIHKIIIFMNVTTILS